MVVNILTAAVAVLTLVSQEELLLENPRIAGYVTIGLAVANVALRLITDTGILPFWKNERIELDIE
tara:strand:- start:6507 stop:6704 length:198 start_codon:yes stop_codon:yes gene_type:complete